MRLRESTDSFDRPANTTAYQDGDLVANSTTASAVDPLQLTVGRGGVRVVGAKIAKSGLTVTNADFTLHLFGSTPTVANGDNGVLSYDFADYIGSIDFDTMVAATDQSFMVAYADDFDHAAVGEGYYLVAGSSQVFGLLECDGAYTPESGEEFTITLITEHY